MSSQEKPEPKEEKSGPSTAGKIVKTLFLVSVWICLVSIKTEKLLQYMDHAIDIAYIRAYLVREHRYLHNVTRNYVEDANSVVFWYMDITAVECTVTFATIE